MGKLSYEEVIKKCKDMGVELLCKEEDWKGVSSYSHGERTHFKYWFKDSKGHDFYRRCDVVLNEESINCNVCARENNIKAISITYEEACKRVRELNCEPLFNKDEWKGVLTKTETGKIYHSYWFLDPNGHEIFRKYNTLVNLKCINCEECAALKIKEGRIVSYEEAVEKTREAGYVLLSTEEEWISLGRTNGNQRFLCNCGNEFNKSYNKIVSALTKCEICSPSPTRPKSYEEALLEAKEKGCVLLCKQEQWNGVKDKYKFIGICGHKFTRTFDNVINRGSVDCTKCAEEKRIKARLITKNDFDQRKEKILKNNNLLVITPYDDFKGNESKVKVICLLCGHEDEVRLSTIYTKNRACQDCQGKISVGESKVASAMKSLGIVFKREAKFKDLEHHASLRVDFYIPTKDIDFKGYVIEVQSTLHDKYHEFFHRSYERFLRYQERDRIKKDYFLSRKNEYKIFYIYDNSKTFDEELNKVLEEITKDKRIQYANKEEIHWTKIRSRVSNGNSIAMYDAFTGSLIKYFRYGMQEVLLEMPNLNKNSISNVLCGKSRHTKGYVFKYVFNDDYENNIEKLEDIKIRNSKGYVVKNRITSEVFEVCNLEILGDILNVSWRGEAVKYVQKSDALSIKQHDIFVAYAKDYYNTINM